MRVPDGVLSTLLEIVGLALMVAAAWLWAPLAGVFTIGGVLVLLGAVLGARSRL